MNNIRKFVLIKFNLFLFLSFLFSNILFAEEDNIIRFDNFKLKKGTKIPYGTKVLLSGDLDPLKKYTAINIYIHKLKETDTLRASILGNTWSAITTEFGVKENIFFQFSVASSIPQENIIPEIGLLIDSVSIKLLKEFTSGTDDELRVFVGKSFDNVVNDTIRSYQTTDGKSLVDIVRDELMKLDVKEMLDIINKYSDRTNQMSSRSSMLQFIQKSIDSNQVYDSLSKYYTKKNGGDTLKLLTSISKTKLTNLKDDEVIQLKDVISSSPEAIFEENAKPDLIRLLDAVITRQVRILEIEEQKNTYVQNIKKKINEPLKKYDTYIANQIVESGAITGDIEHYAGFDFTALYTPNYSFSQFFTVNLYFVKTEINSDPRNFWEFFSFSGGIGIAAKELEPDGLVFSTAIGVRPNKIFRFTIGCIAAKRYDSDGKYIGKWGIGAGINLNYLGQLLKIFNAASSNVTNQ